MGKLITHPGYTEASRKYRLTFVTAHQFRRIAIKLKKMNWMNIMQMIFQVVDAAGDDFEKIKSELENEFSPFMPMSSLTCFP